MSSSRSSSPALPNEIRTQGNSFRSHSPTRPILVEHQIPNHQHLHIHTVRSPMNALHNDPKHAGENIATGEEIFEDDISPPSSISAQILAPFANAPAPSSFKALSSQSSSSTNGRSRGNIARADALGSLSRSSSVKRSQRRRSNEDNALTAQYLDLIGDGHVDRERLEKIRYLSCERGVPGQLRRYVWPILLSQSVRQRPVEPTDEDVEDKLDKVSKRIRGELSRFHRRANRRALTQSSTATPSSAPSSTPPQESSSISSSPSISPPHSPILDEASVDLAVESTIISFLSSNPDIEYSSGMVYLAQTLAQWIFLPPTLSTTIHGFDDSNALLKEAFAGAISLFGQLPSHCCSLRPTRQNSTASVTSVTAPHAAKFAATHRISQFLSAFRLVMPDLARYFDDEGVGGWGDDWVGGWVGWFCSKELSGKTNDLAKARLWDVYFSYSGSEGKSGEKEGGPGEELHVYVCIALLKSCAEALEVLEQSEIRTLLQQLPPVEDVEAILKEASRVKEQVVLAEKEEVEGYIARKQNGGGGSEKSFS